MRQTTRSFATRNVFMLGLLGAPAAALGQMGCSSPAGDSGDRATPADTGSVGLQLTLPDGLQLNTASWTITGPGGASTVVQSGSVDVTNSQEISFLVGGIPAGTGYLVSVKGTTTDGSVTCTGSGTFDMTAQATTDVAVMLLCNTAANTGSALINGSTGYCGTLNSVSAFPAEITVGFPVALSAMASGPDPNGLTYSWAAPSGSFDNASAMNTNFTCSTAGTVMVTLTVSDGMSPGTAACSTALNSQTVQIVCDAPHGSQTFTTSGTFTPPVGVTQVDVLVMGGGGAGGSEWGGGGGSGFVTIQNMVPVSGPVTVTVGTGAASCVDAAGDASGCVGPAGGASSFGTVTAAGGGAGGAGSSGATSLGGNGWSGGGAAGIPTGGDGGSNGGAGVSNGDGTVAGGTGEGTPVSSFGFTQATFAAGADGAGGTTGPGTPDGEGGGGGGGILINGAGPVTPAGAGQTATGCNGADRIASSYGVGFGGGGGGGSSCYQTGGNGADGVVYVEW